uniref:EamA domain-containing protein n=1 Tax=Gongylonema pulchrum TaxID=637853 RepID=A0A183D467_9BILA
LPIVLIFFIVNVSNNMAVRYGVSMPLFIVFRSSTLLANVLLGYLLRNRLCSFKKFIAIILVTVGVVLFTVADELSKRASTNQQQQQQGDSAQSWRALPSSFVGVFLLSLAVFLSAYLGIYQEDLYRTYGKHSEEAMFFVVSLTLTVWIFLVWLWFTYSSGYKDDTYVGNTLAKFQPPSFPDC